MDHTKKRWVRGRGARLLGLVVGIVAVTGRGAAQAPVRVEGTAIVVGEGEGTRVETGCAPSAVHATTDRIYAACPGGRVLEVAVDEGGVRLLGSRQMEGEVTGFFEQGGQVWAALRRTEARPIGPLAGSEASPAPTGPPVPVAPPPALVGAGGEATSPASTEPIPPAPPSAAGEVVEVVPGGVVVSIGRVHGLSVGDRVELYDRRTDALGSQGEAESEEKLAVGVIEVLGEDHARVALGMNERVPVGTLARPTEERRTRSLVNPPRVGGFWEFGGAFRPFIPLESDPGFAFVGDLYVGYRGEAPFFVTVQLAPAGFAVTKGEDPWALGIRALAGYDHRLFSIGLGAGVMRYENEYWDGSTYRRDISAGLLLSQTVRFGALDGLHFAFVNDVLLSDEGSGNEFVWSGMTGRVQVPVASGAWIVARGGGGLGGEAWGEAGLKLMVRGEGGHGTLFVTPSIGAAAITFDNGVVGPMVGLGLDWRI